LGGRKPSARREPVFGASPQRDVAGDSGRSKSKRRRKRGGGSALSRVFYWVLVLGLWGAIAAVGFEMYLQMLQSAVGKLRTGSEETVVGDVLSTAEMKYAINGLLSLMLGMPHLHQHRNSAFARDLRSAQARSGAMPDAPG